VPPNAAGSVAVVEYPVLALRGERQISRLGITAPEAESHGGHCKETMVGRKEKLQLGLGAKEWERRDDAAANRRKG